MGMPVPKSSPPRTAPQKHFTVTSGVKRRAWKLGIYGPEGIGKSTLAASCPGVVVADLEASTLDMDISRVDGISTWTDLRAWVQSLSTGIACIDSMTRAEDWCAQHVIATKKSNDGQTATDSLEDFKYKAGLQFCVDEFRRMLADIDAAMARGVSFIMVAHARISRVKNPDGSDFIRYEPRLIDDPKSSNMLQWVQFLDHLLFIDIDKAITKGKAEGGGSRTIYLDTAPNRMSKTRSLDPVPFEFVRGDGRLWQALGIK